MYFLYIPDVFCVCDSKKTLLVLQLWSQQLQWGKIPEIWVSTCFFKLHLAFEFLAIFLHSINLQTSPTFSIKAIAFFFQSSVSSKSNNILIFHFRIISNILRFLFIFLSMNMNLPNILVQVILSPDYFSTYQALKV